MHDSDLVIYLSFSIVFFSLIYESFFCPTNPKRGNHEDA